MLYLGTCGDLALRDTPSLKVEEIEPGRVAVRQWFTLPTVRYIGAHGTCSCGFPHVIAEEPIEWYPEFPFGGSDREEDLRSVRALLVLMDEQFRTVDTIELYPVMDGDEGLPPKGIVDLDVSDLDVERLFFTERFFYRVSVTRSGTS